VLFRIGRELSALFAPYQLRVWLAWPRTLEACVDFAFSFRQFRPIWQVRPELELFLAEVERVRPRAIVEIGSAGGGSSFLLASAMADDGLLVCVDFPMGPFKGFVPTARTRLWRAFAKKGRRVELLETDSHDRATLDRVGALLAGRPVDVLVIDGDHTYAGVKSDYEMYCPLVRDGGIRRIVLLQEPSARLSRRPAAATLDRKLVSTGESGIGELRSRGWPFA